MGTWEADDPAYSRPIATPLEQCAELLGSGGPQPTSSPYIRVDGIKVWSLMQLERRLRHEVYGRVRGGYITRRRGLVRDHRPPRVDGVSRQSTALGLRWKGPRKWCLASSANGDVAIPLW